MSAAASVARMLTLVPWLNERPGASLAEIAAAFGTDVATVRRDLEALDYCGLPGLGGGALFDVSIVDDRVVVSMAEELRRPMRPTPVEALQLVLQVDAAAVAIGGEVPELSSALDKVRDALGVPQAVAEVIAIEGPGLTDDLRRAVRDRVVVRFDYQKRGASDVERRTVEPWVLHHVDGAWYLQGFDRDREAGRSFRLDRASALEVMAERALAPVPDVLEVPAYHPGEDDVVAVLTVSPGGRWLLDAVEAERVEEDEDGGTRLHLRTDAPEWVARLVVMAGGAARVIEPPDLVARVAARASRALEDPHPDPGVGASP